MEVDDTIFFLESVWKTNLDVAGDKISRPNFKFHCRNPYPDANCGWPRLGSLVWIFLREPRSISHLIRLSLQGRLRVGLCEFRILVVKEVGVYQMIKPWEWRLLTLLPLYDLSGL